MPLAPEKMRWLIDRLLQTSSPTTCPHGRPIILRLTTRDILKGFQDVEVGDDLHFDETGHARMPDTR